MENSLIFKGVGTAMITPFDKSGNVDFESLKKLTERQIKAGTDCLVVCGTTGEASTLTGEERVKIVQTVKAICGDDCKVIAGAGSNNTERAKLYTEEAVEAGADGILAVTPYYNKTTQSGIVRYYQTLCAQTEKPVIAYNVPSRTGLNITPATAKLLCDINGMAGIKEASGNMGQIAETASVCRDKLPIYSGSDELNLPILSVGGMGFISVLSNAVPEKVKEMYNLWCDGDASGAKDLHLSLMPLIKKLFETVNPIPVKKYLYEKGLTEYILRPPLYAE